MEVIGLYGGRAAGQQSHSRRSTFPYAPQQYRDKSSGPDILPDRPTSFRRGVSTIRSHSYEFLRPNFDLPNIFNISIRAYTGGFTREVEGNQVEIPSWACLGICGCSTARVLMQGFLVYTTARNNVYMFLCLGYLMDNIGEYIHGLMEY